MDEQAFHELPRREKEKRERCWDPAERWQVIQEMITWAESLPTVRRNTPARCLEIERVLLARLEGKKLTRGAGAPGWRAARGIHRKLAGPCPPRARAGYPAGLRSLPLFKPR